jgi:C1A family cysteine protease
MNKRIFAVIVTTALLILAMAGSAMCLPTELPDRAATQAEQKVIDDVQNKINEMGYKWTAGVTSVSNLTDKQMKKMCGAKPDGDGGDTAPEKTKKSKDPKKSDDFKTLAVYPSIFDWRDHNGSNWMTPVKSQGSCGSCWAFSAIGVVEAAINIYANNSDLDVDLSEQQLVSSCCYAGDCEGGSYQQALYYVRDTGIATEACFPYQASDSACTLCPDWSESAWKISNTYGTYQQPDYKRYISTYGPMSATMPVYADFFVYSGGVYQRTSNNYKGNHAIVIVGWNDTEDCWIIRNSWGEYWGEDGYARIPRSYIYYRYSARIVNGIKNYAPIATPSATPMSGDVPLTVEFTGTGTDYDGTIVSYDWDFGDGTSSTTQNPTHIYTSHGTYTATLTVTDDYGASRSDSVTISVSRLGKWTNPVAVTASSFFGGVHAPAMAIDDDIGTRWVTLKYGGQQGWIQFDLGSTQPVGKVRAIIHTPQTPKTLDVRVSNNAANWETVVSGFTITEGGTFVEIPFAEVDARYIRLYEAGFVETCTEFEAYICQ